MNEELQQLLGQLASTPNWKYQLGLAQTQEQEQQTAANYLLGQGQNTNQATSIADQYSLGQGQNANALQQTSNQLNEFLQALGLQTQQQNWQQQFAQLQNQQQQSGMTPGQFDDAYIMAGLNGGGKGGANSTSAPGVDPNNWEAIQTPYGSVSGSIYDPSVMTRYEQLMNTGL